MQIGEEYKAIVKSADRYAELRRPRLQAIHDHTKRMGDFKTKKSWLEELVLYVAIWLMARLPLNIDRKYQEDLNSWNGAEEVRKAMLEVNAG